MSNRLADETSPYLRQHADNPVDWWPWCDEALDKARAEDKPVLLSIGYAACHWCHVMAHESFEDQETAALMNRHFVNVKVDREERPDLDRVYQLAHQVITQRPGGWPLTVILDPDSHAPFMAGTYFPREPRYGMPGFKQVLRQVAGWYAENGDRLGGQRERLQEIFARLEPTPAEGDALDREPIARARARLENEFDNEHGGFGGAPKFPHPSSLELLWRLHLDGGDERAGEMLRLSLRAMCEGGLFDQVGGGFYRYTVDERWLIPHFEKMLYDNGPLLALTAECAAATGETTFAEAAHLTADWALREMRAPEGAFYATLDADTGGVEGGSYVWDREEVRAVLGEDHALFARRFGLDRDPNFPVDGEGRWHLHVYADHAELARDFDLTEDRVRKRLEKARRKLFEAREKRPRPGRDDKILTAWNALMIRGLTAAHRHLGRDDCGTAARAALDFIRATLWREDRLHVSYKDGRLGPRGFLDDHACLLEALLDRLQAEWRGADLAWAVALAEALLERFEDRERGGFFFTPHDHERLIHRPKPLADESTPSGNGIAARALVRLGYLTGETRYLEAAERTLRLARPLLDRHAVAHATLLAALDDYLEPPEIVILRGEPQTLALWQRTLMEKPTPKRLCFAIPADAPDLPPALAEKRAGETAVAYVCHGHTCSAPITTPPPF